MKIPAATIILVREAAGGGIEVLLMRRHRKSSFMSNAFVFPGGKVDADDASHEAAAIRELFEEAGVLLCRAASAGGPVPDSARRAEWRRKLNAGEARFADLLRDEALAPDFARLHAWSRWVTPSVEPKRFDAHFYLATMPAGQTTSYDDKETVEEAWLTPAACVVRHADAAVDFQLPPPQLRTLHEMEQAGASLAELVAAADVRAPHVAPIMPRFADLGGKMALLLPWDRDYLALGTGEAVDWPAANPLGIGPSRFILDGTSWSLE